MSTPSKKRRQAREWMHRVTKRHEQECADGMNRARERANREWKDKLTRTIPPDEEGIVYPQGRLEQPYILVSVPEGLPDYAEPVDFSNFDQVRARMDRQWQVVRVNARQMAHILPNGAKLIWWTWEVER